MQGRVPDSAKTEHTDSWHKSCLLSMKIQSHILPGLYGFVAITWSCECFFMGLNSTPLISFMYCPMSCSDSVAVAIPITESLTSSTKRALFSRFPSHFVSPPLVPCCGACDWCRDAFVSPASLHVHRHSRAPSVLRVTSSCTSTRVCDESILVTLGDDVDNVCSLLKEQLNVSSVSPVEDLDIDFSGVVAFAIGHSQALFKVSVECYVQRST